MIWISVLIIIALQYIPTEKPQHHILKDWSDQLIKLTVLDKNWLTTSNPKCTDVSDVIFGNCVYINHMENDPKLLKQFTDLSPFHIFCYTLARRLLEIISLYLARWMSLAFVFLFLSSSSIVLGVFVWKQVNKSSLRKKKRKSPHVPKCFTISMCLIPSLIFLVIIIPIVAELSIGGVLDKELQSFHDDSDQFLIEKVLDQNKPCSTVYDLYYFKCLRKTLFDLDASGVRKSVPATLTLNEKFCLQAKLALINGIAVFAFCILYVVPVLLYYTFFRFCKEKFLFRFKKVDQPRDIEKKPNIWQYVRPLEKQSIISEQCDKKVLEPGTKKPWQGLNFSTNLEDNLECSGDKKCDPKVQGVKELNEKDQKKARSPNISNQLVRGGCDGDVKGPVSHSSMIYRKAVANNRNVHEQEKDERREIKKNCGTKSPKLLTKEANAAMALQESEAIHHPSRKKRRNYKIEKPFLQKSHLTRNKTIKTYSKTEKQSETEGTINSHAYVDAATYVCFDSDDSGESDSSYYK